MSQAITLRPRTASSQAIGTQNSCEDVIPWRRKTQGASEREVAPQVQYRVSLPASV